MPKLPKIGGHPAVQIALLIAGVVVEAYFRSQNRK